MERLLTAALLMGATAVAAAEQAASSLPPPAPPEIHLRALARADQIVARGVTSEAFPGAVLAVGRSSGLVHLRAFGRFTYEPSSPVVGTDTLFDLASLTKVVATTPVAMVLVDQGRLDLEDPVGAHVPCFRERPGRDALDWQHITTAWAVSTAGRRRRAPRSRGA